MREVLDYREWVAWERWNADGYCIFTSKCHLKAFDDDDGNETGRAACGTRIPEHGNGIVHNGEDVSNGLCQTCLKHEVSDFQEPSGSGG